MAVVPPQFYPQFDRQFILQKLPETHQNEVHLVFLA
jgi:hypothetical protein